MGPQIVGLAFIPLEIRVKELHLIGAPILNSIADLLTGAHLVELFGLPKGWVPVVPPVERAKEESFTRRNEYTL